MFVTLGPELSRQHTTVNFTRAPQLRSPVHLGSEWRVLQLLLNSFSFFFALHLLEFCIPLVAKMEMFQVCFLQLSC